MSSTSCERLPYPDHYDLSMQQALLFALEEDFRRSGGKSFRGVGRTETQQLNLDSSSAASHDRAELCVVGE
jgi:hypothetical protein